MLKEIIKNTLLLLGKESELQEVEEKSQAEYSAQTQKVVTSLIKIANLVLGDITRDVSKLYAREEITSDEFCQIMYSSFSKKIIGVKSVSESYLQVTYNLYPEYIKVGFPNTKYLVEYFYENDKCTSIDDNIVLPLGVTAGAVSYGVAAEYASVHLLYDECSMWEQKFVRAMENVREKCGERRAFRWWTK